MFTSTIEGIDELATAWGTGTNLVRSSVSRGVMLGVKEGAEEARRRHTFKNRTGALEKSVEGKAFGWVGGGVKYEGEIRAGARHASFVENPTKPHVIVVRRAKWLHWEEPQGDHHFAKRVRHPGTRGQPFMHLAVFKCERVIIREVEIGIAQAEAFINR